MQILNLHQWDVGVHRAREIQEEFRSLISVKSSIRMKELRWVGGVVEERWVKDRVRFPYIPGLLSVRETPVLLKAFLQLRQRPDAMIFDGQGIAHSRGLGLASHAALFLDLPSVGCAKSRLIGDYLPVGMERGSSSWLEFQGQHVGKVVRTRTNVKPVFVSPGHRMSLQGAADLVLATCRGYRLPEPIRMADQLVNQLR